MTSKYSVMDRVDLPFGLKGQILSYYQSNNIYYVQLLNRKPSLRTHYDESEILGLSKHD